MPRPRLTKARVEATIRLGGAKALDRLLQHADRACCVCPFCPVAPVYPKLGTDCVTCDGYGKLTADAAYRRDASTAWNPVPTFRLLGTNDSLTARYRYTHRHRGATHA